MSGLSCPRACARFVQYVLRASQEAFGFNAYNPCQEVKDRNIEGYEKPHVLCQQAIMSLVGRVALLRREKKELFTL